MSIKKKYALAIGLFILSVLSTFFAHKYVASLDNLSSNPDLILDLYPVITILTPIFVLGFIFTFSAFLFFSAYKKFHLFPYYLSQLSLILIIRSFFITLTHLKIPEGGVMPSFPSVLNLLVTQNDLFFSGHVAVPFLGFLLFSNKKVKMLFLTLTIIMAISVLGLKLHYSIDVFAALFITYSSFKIGEKIFKSRLGEVSNDTKK
jgi:hypothetical protein